MNMPHVQHLRQRNFRGQGLKRRLLACFATCLGERQAAQMASSQQPRVILNYILAIGIWVQGTSPQRWGSVKGSSVVFSRALTPRLDRKSTRLNSSHVS